jgi:putative membrane protein
VSIFAAAFSPFVFVYFVYAMYRIWIKEAKNLLWFVCITAFLFCLFLSIRQRLELENYLPFCVISVPILVRVFFSSYRVRLPMFRRGYKILASFVATSLLAGFLFVLFNEMLYGALKDPTRHFVYRYHVAKELAKELKNKGIENIVVEDNKLALRLKFYGIDTQPDANLRLAILDQKDNYGNIAVYKFGVKIANFKIIKDD